MKFLEDYKYIKEKINSIKYTLIGLLFLNMILSFIFKSFLFVILAGVLLYLYYKKDKELAQIEDAVFRILPHDLEEDGYYQVVSEENLEQYTYYFDKEEGYWIVEYPLNKTEAKIIKLNEFKRFTFFSTINNYQPILQLKHYEIKSEVKKWFEEHPETNAKLMPKKIVGELKFENIYKD